MYYNCKKYEDESTSLEECKCKHAFYIDVIAISGNSVPKQIAVDMGILTEEEKNGNWKCKLFEEENEK